MSEITLGSKHLRAISLKDYFLELNFNPQNNSWLFLQTGPMFIPLNPLDHYYYN